MNQEILKAIQDITITSEDGFDYQGSIFGFEHFDKEIQTKNYSITLKFVVWVRFSSTHDYKCDGVDILEFKVYKLKGAYEIDPKITHEQVANNLNIAL